jgi:hypothetical protein
MVGLRGAPVGPGRVLGNDTRTDFPINETQPDEENRVLDE